MSNLLPSREQAIALLQKNHCSPQVVAHCKGVSQLAVEAAQKCQKKGIKVDVALVEMGGLLHDLGRAKTHTVNHAVVGAEMAKEAGLPDAVVCIIKRHVGGGITAAEAEKLGWPKDNYVPQTLEEKLVSYADKLVEAPERGPIELTLKKLREEKMEASAQRVQNLHEEITRLIGEKP